jgi:hypothetical protein
MKLRVVVVDLEIPSRVKRWALKVGIPLGVLLGGGAIAWAQSLHVWNTGDTLQATDLNGNFSNLQNQITALQTQMTTLQSSVVPTYLGFSNDSGTVTHMSQNVPATEISITPTANVYCVVVTSCDLGTAALGGADGALVDIGVSEGGGAYSILDVPQTFPSPQNGPVQPSVSATTTVGFTAQSGNTYTFTSVIGNVAASATAECDLSVVCGAGS